MYDPRRVGRIGRPLGHHHHYQEPNAAVELFNKQQEERVRARYVPEESPLASVNWCEPSELFEGLIPMESRDPAEMAWKQLVPYFQSGWIDPEWELRKDLADPYTIEISLRIQRRTKPFATRQRIDIMLLQDMCRSPEEAFEFLKRCMMDVERSMRVYLKEHANRDFDSDWDDAE